MPFDVQKFVRVYFEVLFAFRERMRQLGDDPSPNMKSFGLAPIGQRTTDPGVQQNLIALFGEVGGAVPLPFPGPDTLALDFVDASFRPPVRFRLLALYFSVAAKHDPALMAVPPDAILTQLIEEVFDTQAAQNDLRNAVDSTVPISFREGLDPAQNGITVGHSIERMVS